MDCRRKNSKKRQAILDALCADKRHPTAEMLYQSLKPAYPELSLGTVYRNLSILVEDGDAAAIGRVDGQERYDGCMAPHGHFVCRSCRRIFDLDLPSLLADVCSDLCVSSGCTMDACSLSVSGCCRECRSNA